ncbi:ABC transporter substrate-binding protein [Actinokineospora sp. 24-640]
MNRIVVGLQYMHPWPNDAGLVLARQLGWFAEVGLDVRFVLPDLHHGRPSDYLLRGDVDVALLPSSRVPRAAARATGRLFHRRHRRGVLGVGRAEHHRAR